MHLICCFNTVIVSEINNIKEGCVVIFRLHWHLLANLLFCEGISSMHVIKVSKLNNDHKIENHVDGFLIISGLELSVSTQSDNQE